MTAGGEGGRRAGPLPPTSAAGAKLALAEGLELPPGLGRLLKAGRGACWPSSPGQPSSASLPGSFLCARATSLASRPFQAPASL